MASIHTTSTEAARLLRDYFEQVLMETLDAEMLIGECLTAKVIAANSGNRADFHRIQNMQFQTVGITQNFGAYQVSGLLKGETYTVDSVSVGLDLVGNDMQLSEQLVMTSEPNPVPELSDRFLYNGLGTLEQRYSNLCVSSAGTNGSSNSSTAPSVNYAGASTSVSVIWGDGSATLTEATLDADIPTHRIAAETFNIATGRLRTDSVMPLKKLGRRFGAFIHPGQGAELRMDGTFQELALRGDRKGEEKFETAAIGEVFNCLVMETPFVFGAAGTIDATNDTLYRAFVIGEDYAGRVSHAKGVGRPRVSYLPPKPSPADPYGNIGWFTWKAYMGGVVLNPLAGEILKSASIFGRGGNPEFSGPWE